MITDTKVADLPAKWRKYASAKRTTEYGHGTAHAALVLADELEAALARQTPSYEALEIIARSVASALERADVTECDDPGEAIDVMREEYQQKLAALARQEAVAQDASSLIARLTNAAGLMLSEIDTCGHEVDPAYRLALYEAWEEGKTFSAAPPAQAVPEDVRRDAERLDFVLSQMAWIRTKQADSGALTYWLETQDEDENFIRLSGPGFHRNARAAIDAAMSAQPQGEGVGRG